MDQLSTIFFRLLGAGRFPLIVFAIHCFLSLGFRAYDRLDWLDVVMHTLGGIAIANFFDRLVDMLNDAHLTAAQPRAGRAMMIIGLVAFAAIVWELAEFTADSLFQVGAQRSLTNVMKDQVFGLAGGTLYVLGIVWYKR